MSEETTGGYATPLKTMFEMQRNGMEMGKRLLEQSKSFQRNAAEGMVMGLRGQETAQRQALELSRITTQTYINGMKMAMPGSTRNVESLQRTVDAQFDDVEAIHSDAFDDMEANIGEFEALVEEYIETIQEQTTATEDAQHRIEIETVRSADEMGRAAERSMSEAVDATGQVAKASADTAEDAAASTAETVERTAEATEEMTERSAEATEEMTERSAEATEDVAETAVDATDEMAERSAEATEEAAEGAEDAASEMGRPSISTRIDDVDDGDVESLRQAGIESLEDLAQAQADAVAEAADVSKDRAQEWIDAAGT